MYSMETYLDDDRLPVIEKNKNMRRESNTQ